MHFAFLGLVGCAFASAEQQIMVLFDTTRLGLRETDMPIMLADALEAIADDHTSFAVSSFSDKPTPYNGIGIYGGYANSGYKEDYCYESHLDFTKDTKAVREALLDLPASTGLDLWEGNFDAMVFASVDSKVGWSPSAEKIILMVSDAYGHSGVLDRLVDSVGDFNTPVRCSGGKTRGGFGAIEPNRASSGWTANEGDYNQYAQFLYKVSCVDDLTADEQALFDSLREKMPVRVYPKVQPFDLEVVKSDPDTACRYHEYPDYEQVKAALEQANIKFFLLYAKPQDDEARAVSDDLVWDWVLNDAVEGLGAMPNTWAHVTNLNSLKAVASPTDSNSPPSSLEAILRNGLATLATK